MTHQIVYIAPDELKAYYLKLLPYLEKAHTYTPEYTLVDTLDSINRGTSDLYAIVKEGEAVGVFITKIERHPQLTYLLIHMIGGDGLKDWISLVRSEMKNYATGMGFDGVVIHGRPGWKKIFPNEKVERITMIDRIERGGV
jgi:hypothetical protein